jgi:hypothetical protein
VLVARDRHGETADCILNGTSAEQIGAALTPLLNKEQLSPLRGHKSENNLFPALVKNTKFCDMQNTL